MEKIKYGLFDARGKVRVEGLNYINIYYFLKILLICGIHIGSLFKSTVFIQHLATINITDKINSFLSLNFVTLDFI